MTQLIYAVSALGVIMLFSVGIQRVGLTGEQEMYITEARTRMLGVARETVEQISRLDMPFDAATDPDQAAQGQFPYVDDPAKLTSVSSFGGCTYLSTCKDIDDFDGLSVADSAQGIPVTLDFEVAYVNALTGEESASATYAKQLRVIVSTVAINRNGAPLVVSYSRVFAYPNTMDFARGVQSRL